MSKPVRVTYTGGIDEVSVLLPSGDYRVVRRGDTIEVLATDAASLHPDDWSTVAAPKGDDK